MSTDIESILRGIEVARTKLQLLAHETRDDDRLKAATSGLTDVHALLTGIQGNNTAAPIAPAPAMDTSSTPKAAGSDFTLIKSIDDDVSDRLNTMGISTYEEMVAWTQNDVEKISTELSLQDRISRENWIEQAAILAKDADTQYSKRIRALRPDRVNDAPAQAPAPTPAPTSGGDANHASAPTPAATTTAASAALAAATMATSGTDHSSTIADRAEHENGHADTNPAEISEPGDEVAVSETHPAETIETAETVETVEVSAPPAQSENQSPSSGASREASIEIRQRAVDQSAYPNSDEDPDEVVKRFMRALTGKDET